MGEKSYGPNKIITLLLSRRWLRHPTVAYRKPPEVRVICIVRSDALERIRNRKGYNRIPKIASNKR